jgi:6-pyruvoyl tetrahydropterin synthase/QueD family protein
MIVNSFSIQVVKENFKFSAAHFVAREDFRGALHGHNYTVAIRLEGSLGDQGYVVDFGVVKQIAKSLVDALDEKTLIPTKSPVIRIEKCGDTATRIICHGDEFILPRNDLFLIPIAHSTCEELSRYIAQELQRALEARPECRSVRAVEVCVAELPGESATFRLTLHDKTD